MKDLKISSVIKISLPDLNSSDFVESGKAITNNDTKTLQRNLYVFQNDTLYLLTINQGIHSKCNVSHLFPDEVSPVKGMLFVDIFDALYSFHETGEILSFTSEPNSSSLKGDFFTQIDGEIVTLEWSPDKEIGAYISHDNKLRLLISTPTSFDIIYEYDMGDTAKGKQELINLGWGKKETQFHGLEGKNAAVSKLESYLEESFYNKSVHISWRGDSTMFAVGYWCNSSNKRRVKIFSKEGVLLCINEDIPGLDGPMSWKPQGNLIALSQQLPNKYVIAFMEKNGLKHLDFELPKGFTVKYLSWNTDSNILCTLVEQKESTENNLMLWTCGNYHWYLKQMFPLDFQVTKIFWDEDRENKLYIVGRKGIFYDIEFSWIIDHSNYSTNANKHFVSVIDNDKILLTPFHKAIIPPPMCKWTLKCPASVIKIIYPPTNVQDEGKYFMCAFLHDGRFCFFSEQSGEPVISKIDETLRLELTSELSFYHWIWASNTNVVCVSPFVENHSTILKIQIDEDRLVITEKSEINHLVVAVTTNNKNIFMYLIDGKFIEYDVEQNSLSEIKEGFPETCHHVIAHLEDVYGLSEWNRLYKNDTVISYNVTSFLLHYPFLLATTSNQTLITFNCEGGEFEEISVRKLERGSKLVAVTGNTVIMQLPRGNLETIQPRALTILSAGELLDKKLYKEAVQLLRRQRICFDLCVDHNPSEFFENIEHFVQSVDPQWITLLVTELTPNDVTKGVYKLFYRQKREYIYQEDEKINKVCSVLLEAMLSTNDEEKYMLPILSCLVKTKHTAKAIEKANTDQALQHLLFLVDVDTLYYEALGAYNLEAALRIAGKSQMDPKEYVPYLNSLKKMENNYMKYEIDIMLKKNSSALRHLSKCEDDKLELMYILIEESHLYNLALKLFENQPERFAKVAFMYGEYLYKQARFEESGIMFLRSNNLQKAITAFSKSGNWRQCMLLAKCSNCSDDEIKNIRDVLCSTLISSQKFKEAADLCKECYTDINKTVDIYLLGHFWNEAIYLAECSGMEDLIETVIKKNVLDTTDVLVNEINSNKTKMLGYIRRLKQVRNEKNSKPNFRDFDEMSDTSSVTSRSNLSSTSRSSRMTKKMNRKMWSLKEGNPREEEALVATLSQIMSNSEKLVGEIQNISITLLHLKSDEKGELLQNTMQDLLNIIEQAKSDIWPKDPNEDETAVLDAKFKYPPELSTDPKWKLAVYNNN